ncbi:type VI secretion system Vgr family protein [Sphingomonas sp. NPDC079357]|uniref:type VI secretion system Vgr family protein n=1 Tax=Sphingomonas sp. NPDC079357 TaxID=3364518 RepID=UPI00384F6195
MHRITLTFGIPGVFAPHRRVFVQDAIVSEGLECNAEAQLTLAMIPPLPAPELSLDRWTGNQGVLLIEAVDADSEHRRCVAGTISQVRALFDSDTMVRRIELTLHGWPAAREGRSFAANYCFFEAVSSTDMARLIFESAGGGIHDATTAPAPARDYEVQYGESDEAFVRRVLAEDGRGGVIRATWQSRTFPVVPLRLELSLHDALDTLNDPGSPFNSVVHLSVQPQFEGHRHGVFDLVEEQIRAPQSVALTAYSPSNPNVDLRSASSAPTSEHRWVTIETFVEEDTPATLADHAERRRRASLAVRGSFRTSLPWLFAGEQVTLRREAHGKPTSTGRVALVESRQAYHRSDMGLWSCTADIAFRAVDSVWLPTARARPRLPGLLPGVVLDAAGRPDDGKQHPTPDAAVHTDAMGRIRVRILWHSHAQVSDRADSTIWVRVMTPWAGHKAGFFALPRAGQEVLVSFVNGDPARPVVLGAVFGEVSEAGSMPPWDMAGGAHWVGMGTRSGTGSPEHIRMSADPDRPRVELAAAENLTITAARDVDIKAGDSVLQQATRQWSASAPHMSMTASAGLRITTPALSLETPNISLTATARHEIVGSSTSSGLTKTSVLWNSANVMATRENLIGASVQSIVVKYEINLAAMQQYGVKIDEGRFASKYVAYETKHSQMLMTTAAQSIGAGLVNAALHTMTIIA